MEVKVENNIVRLRKKIVEIGLAEKKRTCSVPGTLAVEGLGGAGAAEVVGTGATGAAGLVVVSTAGCASKNVRTDLVESTAATTRV